MLERRLAPPKSRPKNKQTNHPKGTQIAPRKSLAFSRKPGVGRPKATCPASATHSALRWRLHADSCDSCDFS
eukprot:2355487-Prymnesium_polylepis.1